jgi:hypothetical protein
MWFPDDGAGGATGGGSEGGGTGNGANGNNATGEGDGTGQGGEGDGGGGDNDNKQVSYESHRRLLNEMKKEREERRKLQAELAERAQREKEAEEKRLAEQNEWKKIAENREKELKEKEDKLKGLETERQDARKLDAFLTALKGKVDPKYWPMIDLESIAIDPESGRVDEMTVARTVEDFRKDHGRLIDTPGNGDGMPPNAPESGGNQKLTDEAWKKLPLKERKARMSEYYQQKYGRAH